MRTRRVRLETLDGDACEPYNTLIFGLSEVFHVSWDEDEVVTLVDEDGDEHNFTVLDVLEVEGREYAILVPLEEGVEAGEVVIFRFDEDEAGNEILVDIEDEEWEKVADAWQEKVGQEH